MAKDYQLIQAQTLTGSAASVTFSNIPQNFTDLVLKVSIRSTSSSGDCTMIFNGSTASAYSGRLLYGDGSAAAAASNNSQANMSWGAGSINRSTTTANVFANGEVYIPNYTSSNFKSVSTDSVEENNAVQAYAQLAASLWSNTASITSITLTPSGSGNFVTNSTFYLYGIGSTRATGGTITSDQNYTYHTFTSTSTFTPLEKIKNAEVLVIAGGGASTGTILNGYATAGGGAGGLVYSSGQTFFAGTSYTAVVGAGGAAGASGNTARGGNGENSQFGSVTLAVGGGAGGAQPESPTNLRAGAAGGSGGGGFLAAGGTATSGQGNAGGNAAGDHPYLTSGGGGAGEVGGVGAGDRTSGRGGNGSSAYTQWGLATGTGELSGGVYYYAGGGAGGLMHVTSTVSSAGGLGGGGSNTSSTNGKTNGTANTGGGASGVNGYAAATAGASGGSGLIIVRYPSN